MRYAGGGFINTILNYQPQSTSCVIVQKLTKILSV